MSYKHETTLTERGQVSLPSQIRKRLNLKPGAKLTWQQISSNEIRVLISTNKESSAPSDMLGYAKRFKAYKKGKSSDQVLKELREGESS